MSTALAIAGVTAVLRDLLNDGLINHNVSAVLGNAITVSALPPDRIFPANGSEPTQLNLFLHQVTPNPGWRNEGLPARDSSGRIRTGNPPLALDLHYLLSAYGAHDLHAEILLGYAMQLLHEMPVLSRSAISTALNPSPPLGAGLPPELQALASCGLADQLEQIRITPEYFNTDEMSKLWTAVQSHYRPTAAYVATAVLIESTRPARATLPVLTRGPVDPESGRDRGALVEPSLLAPLPTIQSVVPTSLQPAATVGSAVDIRGHHLDGTQPAVLLTGQRFAIAEEVPPDSSTPASVKFTVPDLPVGLYQLALQVILPAENAPRTSNQLALVVGPEITTPFPITVTRDSAGAATITIDFRPEARPGQQVSLLLGLREVPAGPLQAATGKLTFVVENALPGDYLLRLRVDGIESPIVDRTVTPPVFFNYRATIV